MTTHWILRDALGTELTRSDFMNQCIGYLYHIDRPAHKAMRRLVHEHDYATTHTAGGYTLERGE